MSIKTKLTKNMSAITSRIQLLDESLAHQFSFYSKNKKLRNLLLVFEYIFHGVPWFLIVISACFLMDKSYKATILFLALIIDVIFVGLLKKIFKRPRPKVNHTEDMVIGTNYGVDKFSFPSGHSSRAILMSGLLPYLFASELSSVSLLFALYFMSYMTCVSRFVLTRHYFTDVIAGVLLGHFNYFIIIYLIPNSI